MRVFAAAMAGFASFVMADAGHAQTLEETVRFIFTGDTESQSVRVMDEENCIIFVDGHLFHDGNPASGRLYLNNVITSQIQPAFSLGFSFVVFPGNDTVASIRLPAPLGFTPMAETEDLKTYTHPVGSAQIQRVLAAVGHLYQNFCTGSSSAF